jgi:uncharacterized protein RhaS with RHS repeats
MSEDPIEFEGGGFDFYAYVGNNPMNLADPLGLTDCVVTATAVVCTNRGPGLKWLTPQEPRLPLPPDELSPNLFPPCGCDKIREINERAGDKAWETIYEFAETTTLVNVVKEWGRDWAKRLVPGAEVLDKVHLEYSLLKIERDREQAIRNVHVECGDTVPNF